MIENATQTDLLSVGVLALDFKCCWCCNFFHFLLDGVYIVSTWNVDITPFWALSGRK